MDNQQLEIIQTVTAMFDAAPGEQYLSEFVAFTTNTGSSVKTLASLLAATDVFKQSAYPDTLPDNEFAAQFVDNTVGSLVTAENKAWAASTIENMLNAGQSRGEVIHWAATALASVDTDDAHWGAAARQFNNKVEVAAFYSVDQGGSATSLAVLQQVIANVTDDIATVASAKALLESGVTGKVIDGYVKGATVFADLNGDGVHNEDEPSTTTDAFGNFTLPGVTGFGNLIASGGTDIATGEPFEGTMTAPAGSTVINPLTTLIDKIMQDSATTAAEATAKVLTSLGLNTGVDLLNFDPIQETIRTDTNATATGIALTIHAAAVKINILISQAAALLSGVGVSANEAAGIDLAYETLASSLANTTSTVDLASSSVIAQVIQDATVNSGADTALLFKAGAVIPDASKTISNLNQAISDAITGSTANKSSLLSSIAAIQIVAENTEATMQSGAAAGNVESTVTGTTGTSLTNAITTAGTTVGDVTGDGIPDTPPPPSSGGGGGGGGSIPSTVQSYLATNATAFTGTSANDILSVSTAATYSPLVMITVILDGGTGTNTLSVQDGSSIASAVVLNFPNLTFDATGVTLTNDVTMSASQNQLFTGTITAAGTGANGEKITIVGDGAITTLAGVETYSIGDDSTDKRTITVSNAGTSVTADSATDAITFNLGALAYTGSITGNATTVDTLSLNTGANISNSGTIGGVTALTLTSNAAVTMKAAQNQLFTGTITAPGNEKITISGDGAITTRSNIETYELGDDTTNARTVTIGSAALNLIANIADDTVTINAAALEQNTALTISAASASTLIVNSLKGDMVATQLSGSLTITTADAADNGISITTGSAAASVNVSAGAASDTLSINAAALANNTALTITSGGGTAGIVNITNLTGDLIVSNPTAGTVGVTAADNTIDNEIAITAGSANLTISNVANGDTVSVTGFTGSTLTGTIAGTTGKFVITAGAGTSAITTAAGDDNFTFTASSGLTSADIVNGGAGSDTITLDGNGAVALSDFNAVTNVEAIKFTNRTSGNVAITTLNTLVANGVTLTLTHAGTGTLTFNGSAETDGGKFDITETTSTGVSAITGGTGNDKFTFIASNLTTDTVNGGAGTDTLNLTGTGAVTLTNVSNIEAITLPDMTSTAVSITATNALAAAGATLTLSNAANSGALTFNASADTDSAFSVTGGSGNDTFTFAASTGLTSGDTVDGGAGTDALSLTAAAFTASNDFDNVTNIETITVANTTQAITITTKDTLVAAGAILTLTASSLTSGTLTFDGSAEQDGAFNINLPVSTGADIITGGKGNDTFNAGNGNNIINPGLGNDTITGGTGSDTFTFAAVTGLTSADTVDGSTGTDTVTLTGDTAFTASNDFDNASNIETITLGNTTTAVTITTKDALVASTATLTLSNAVNSGALTFNGSAETDGKFSITGGTGNDSITGGSGNDTISGGVGSDTLDGGAGNDTISDSAGTNTITAGLGNDNITGGADNDTFTFAAVTGLTIADTVNGSTGTDTVALTGDTAFTASNDFNNVSNIETITLANTTTAVTITTADALVASGATLTLSNAANSGALTFIGSLEANGNFSITGGTGNDTITGGAGNDNITGGEGDDTLTGGSGNDTLDGGAGNDTISDSAGTNTITAGLGNDNITGGADNDTFTFAAVTGLTIADTVNGSTGTDTVALTGDTAFTASNDFNNVSNIETITLANTTTAVTITTADALVASGATLTLSNAANSGALTFIGSLEANGNFSITGGTGNDTITGGAGNDNITGGEGDDTLTGGSGNDTLDGGAGNDTISDSAGTNTITAGLGNDTITGGTGSDTFTFAAVTGLTSADTVDGSTGTDTVALTGNTTFTASNDFDNVSNIETITLANTTTIVTITTVDALVASGATLTLSNAANSGALTFIGSAETNGKFSITGGTGNDSITGGTGNDTFTFAAVTGLTSADTVDGSTGTDTVALTGNTTFTASNDFDNVSNIETITLANTNTAVTITTKDVLVASGATLTLSNAANSGALTFIGSAETNGKFSITGGTGDDSITGGAGIDTLNGGAGNDIINYATTAELVASSAFVDSITGGANTDEIKLTTSSGITIAATDSWARVTTVEKITAGSSTGIISIATNNNITAAGITTIDLSGDTDVTGNNIIDVSADAASIIATITGSAGIDTITGNSIAQTISGGTGADTITGGAGTDNITGGAGADSIILGSSADDNTRQIVVYSSTSDGAAAGADNGADTVTQFDANANDATDDLIQITGTLKTAADDDSDGSLDYSSSDGTDSGNQAIVGGANQEATVLLDAEIGLVLADFTTVGLANVLTELGEEIDFTAIATGEEHLFLVNFSTTQAALVLYTAGTGGDDTIISTDIQVLGIVTHNDGTGLAASNLTF